MVKVIHSAFGVMFIGHDSYFPYMFRCETRKCEQLYRFHISPRDIVRMDEICQNLGFISLVKTKKMLNVETSSENPGFSFWVILLILNMPCAFVMLVYKYGLSEDLGVHKNSDQITKSYWYAWCLLHCVLGWVCLFLSCWTGGWRWPSGCCLIGSFSLFALLLLLPFSLASLLYFIFLPSLLPAPSSPPIFLPFLPWP